MMYHGTFILRQNGKPINRFGQPYTAESEGLKHEGTWERLFISNLKGAIGHIAPAPHPIGAYARIERIDTSLIPEDADLQPLGNADYTVRYIPPDAIKGSIEVSVGGKTGRDLEWHLERATRHKGWK